MFPSLGCRVTDVCVRGSYLYFSDIVAGSGHTVGGAICGLLSLFVDTKQRGNICSGSYPVHIRSGPVAHRVSDGNVINFNVISIDKDELTN